MQFFKSSTLLLQFQNQVAIMISPTPFSLLCALLLCFPLAVIFTTTTTTTTTTSTASVECKDDNFTFSDAYSAAYGGASTARVRPLSALVLTSAKATKEPYRNITSPTNSSSNATAYGEGEGYYLDREDMELFRLAGRVRPDPDKWKGKNKKKVAFMFLTTAPLPFAPLWEVFFRHAPRNLYNVYVHADPGFDYAPPFGGVFSDRVIPSKPTRRHSPTLIAAARRLLSRALLHDEANYMFALLSPSCVPLRSFNFTYRFLSRSRRSFIEILKDEPGAYDRWVARGDEAMLPELKFEDFRIGSQFFVLKRKHALAVARDTRLWSKFRLPCLRSRLGGCYPEEHYFPSLLNMVDPIGLVPATLTGVDWKGSFAGHPRMYQAEEVGPELIMKLRNRQPRYGGGALINGSDSWGGRHHPFLFARKFAADSLSPLMSIAEDVLFKD